MTVWRVYLPEWHTAYLSDHLEVDGQNECKAAFAEYEGRVREEDWRVTHVGSMRPSRYRLELRLPNLKGEFRYKEHAAENRDALGPEAVIVARGSAEERELLSYGRRRLPA